MSNQNKNQVSKIIEKTISLDEIISKIEDLSNSVSKKVELSWDNLSKPSESSNFICTDKIYEQDSYNNSDLLQDMQYLSSRKNKFINYLKQKSNFLPFCSTKKLILNFEEELKTLNADDTVCMICNDGDYEDDDMIVFCSVIKINFK